jgi:prepilin signal peptidase PulO-like enzyme (type II secretory pathway)
VTASHLLLLLVFSALVSLVFTFLQRETNEARVKFGAKVFGAFVLSTFVIGWLMAQLH